MGRSLLRALPGWVAVLAAGEAAGAAGVDGILSQVMGREVELNSGVLMTVFLANFPIAMLAVWLAARMMMTYEEELGGKAFVIAFFHRLMFTVGFWCVIMLGLHERAPIPPTGVVFLTSLVMATIAFRFSVSEPMARILVMAVVFCVLDSVLLGVVMAGSLVAFG
jgi:hypothetical protein